MGLGLQIETAGLPITPDLKVLYLIGTKSIHSKMSDQQLSFFSSSSASGTYPDWYYNRLNVAAYLASAPEATGIPPANIIQNKTAVLRRFEITDLVSMGCTVFAITAIPGLPSKAYVYKEDGKHYLRYSATSAADLDLVIYGFGSSLPSPKDSIGFALYGADGTVSFDTSRYPMRLANKSLLNSSNKYAYICQYTQSLAYEAYGANYDYGYEPVFVWSTGSCPEYIGLDYKTKADTFLCDAWRWQSNLELWDTDEWDRITSTVYGVESPLNLLNVTGYLN